MKTNLDHYDSLDNPEMYLDMMTQCRAIQYCAECRMHGQAKANAATSVYDARLLWFSKQPYGMPLNRKLALGWVVDWATDNVIESILAQSQKDWNRRKRIRAAWLTAGILLVLVAWWAFNYFVLTGAK